MNDPVIILTTLDSVHRDRLAKKRRGINYNKSSIMNYPSFQVTDTIFR